MLGEQITELKGKTTGRRVLSIETSISASGIVRGTQVNESITFVAKPASEGVLHGKGQGVIMAGNSEMAMLAGGNWENYYQWPIPDDLMKKIVRYRITEILEKGK